jgi:NaMN:DMB phosphoribosyltransferase
MVALNQTPVNPSFSTIPTPITANFTILTPVFIAILLMNKQSYSLFAFLKLDLP